MGGNVLMKKQQIDMNVAKQALSDTEFKILTTLYEKVRKYELERDIHGLLQLQKVLLDEVELKKVNIDEPFGNNHITFVPLNFSSFFDQAEIEHAEIEREVYRLKNKGMSDDMIGRHINEAINSGQNIISFLKKL